MVAVAATLVRLYVHLLSSAPATLNTQRGRSMSTASIIDKNFFIFVLSPYDIFTPIF
jgi:hypothetical protein